MSKFRIVCEKEDGIILYKIEKLTDTSWAVVEICDHFEYAEHRLGLIKRQEMHLEQHVVYEDK